LQEALPTFLHAKKVECYDGFYAVIADSLREVILALENYYLILRIEMCIFCTCIAHVFLVLSSCAAVHVFAVVHILLWT